MGINPDLNATNAGAATPRLRYLVTPGENLWLTNDRRRDSLVYAIYDYGRMNIIHSVPYIERM